MSIMMQMSNLCVVFMTNPSEAKKPLITSNSPSHVPLDNDGNASGGSADSTANSSDYHAVFVRNTEIQNQWLYKIMRFRMTDPQFRKALNPHKPASHGCYTVINGGVKGLFWAMALIKVFASAGQRVFGVRDLLTSEHSYLGFSLSHSSGSIAAWIISIGDLMLNAYTRITSTVALADEVRCGVKDHKTVSQSAWADLNGLNKALALLVLTCSVLSSLFSSSSAFLGIATITEYVTADRTAVLGLAAIGMACNIVNNFGFKVREGFNNTTKILRDGLSVKGKSALGVVVGLATLAFVGGCDFGTSNSLRHIFDLLNLYAADQATPKEQERWEAIIKNTTNFSLVVAFIAYLSSQGAKPFVREKAHDSQDDDVEAGLIGLKQVRDHGLSGACQYGAASSLFYMLGSALSVFIALEMTGNGFSLFNGGCGLLARMPFIDMDVWWQRLAVTAFAVLTTVSSSILYWGFNIHKWQQNDAAFQINSQLPRFFSSNTHAAVTPGYGAIDKTGDKHGESHVPPDPETGLVNFASTEA